MRLVKQKTNGQKSSKNKSKKLRELVPNTPRRKTWKKNNPRFTDMWHSPKISEFT